MNGNGAPTDDERSFLRDGDAAGVTDRAVLGVRMISVSRNLIDDSHVDLVDYINRQIALTFDPWQS